MDPEGCGDDPIQTESRVGCQNLYSMTHGPSLLQTERRRVRRDNKYRDSGQLRWALEKSPQKIPAKLAGLSTESLVLRCFGLLTEFADPGERPDSRHCPPFTDRYRPTRQIILYKKETLFREGFVQIDLELGMMVRAL